MIAHLRGVLIEKSPGRAIVEAAGVGYDVAIAIPTFTVLPAIGQPVALHIYTHVREDALSLFGFSTTREKSLFEKLLSISGIGPKLALTILSGLEPDRLIAAIRSNDHAQLTRIPGVGKKTSERVTLELKDKLDAFAVPGASPTGSAPLPPVAEDVRSALENLGYPRAAAERALELTIKQHPAAADFETLFRAAVASIK
jgi:holliday junction DNA helicase RuvA